MRNGSKQNQGLHLVLLGPDGSGKSTLLPLLQARLEPHFSGIDSYHWRPKLFSDAGVAAGARKATNAPTTDPHGKPPHGFVLSLARLLYYLADYWLGSFPIRKAKAQGRLVLFDRYAPDMACDPRRYRFGLRPGFLQKVCALVPQPDLGFILTGDAAMLYARKREVPLETLKGLLERYGAVPRDLPAYQTVDCSRMPDEIADEIAAKVLAYLNPPAAQPR